jgi:hypothetical protein
VRGCGEDEVSEARKAVRNAYGEAVYREIAMPVAESKIPSTINSQRFARAAAGRAVLLFDEGSGVRALIDRPLTAGLDETGARPAHRTPGLTTGAPVPTVSCG